MKFDWRSFKIIEITPVGRTRTSSPSAFRSNYDLMLYRFWDKAIYWSKIAIFIPHLHSTLSPYWQAACQNFTVIFLTEKLKWWNYPNIEKNWRYVCFDRLEPAPHFWHSGRKLGLTFFVSHTADVAPSTPMVSRRLHWAVLDFCKVPRNCVMAALKSMTFVVVVVVVVVVVEYTYVTDRRTNGHISRNSIRRGIDSIGNRPG